MKCESDIYLVTACIGGRWSVNISWVHVCVCCMRIFFFVSMLLGHQVHLR